MDQEETNDQDLKLKKKRKLDKQEQKEVEKENSKPQSATNDNPNELTIQQLKDHLREMGEKLPVHKASKKEYVELYNKAKSRRGAS